MKIKSYKQILTSLTMAFLFMANSSPAWANTDPNVNIYNGNTATENNGVMISGIGAIAVGDNNTAIGIAGQIIVLQNGEKNNGVSLSPAGIQLGQDLSGNTWDNGAEAIGTDNTAIGTGAFAYGGKDTDIPDGGRNTAIGRSSIAYGYDNTAIGAGAVAYGGNSVALGNGSIANESNTVSVGSPDHERRIMNVAPGYYDTDAVNMSQLRSVDNKVNRVGSIAMAMSGLAPLPYDPKDPTQYSAAYGTYNGTGAVALGVYHYTKPTVMYNMAVAMSDDKWEKSARFGVTWRTGGAKPKVLTPTAVKKTDEQTLDSGVKIILADRVGAKQ